MKKYEIEYLALKKEHSFWRMLQTIMYTILFSGMFILITLAILVSLKYLDPPSKAYDWCFYMGVGVISIFTAVAEIKEIQLKRDKENFQTQHPELLN